MKQIMNQIKNYRCFNTAIVLSLLLILCFAYASCSSLPKARLYSGLGGAVVGAGLGVAAGEVIGERNGYTKKSNTMSGAAIGAIVGAVSGIMLANFFWHEDPENREMKQMIIKNNSQNSLSATDSSSTLPSSNEIFVAREKALIELFKKNNPNATVYNVDSEPLPQDLKDEVMKQKIIIYDIPEQVIRLQDGRTILIKKTIAKEHFFQE